MAKKDDLKLLKSEMKTVRENLNKALEKENQKKIEKEDENAETLSSVRTKIEKLESKPPVLILTISDLASWSRARILEISWKFLEILLKKSFSFSKKNSRAINC